MKLSEILEIFFQSERLTLIGLIRYGAGLFAAWLLIFPPIREYLPADYLVWIFWSVLLISQMINWFAWLAGRHRLCSRPQWLTIGVAIGANEESKIYYDQTVKILKRHLTLHGLDTWIRISRLPSDTVFESKDQAEQFIRKRNIPALIWGDTTSGSKQNESGAITQFNVFISYLYNLEDSLSEDRRLTIESAVAKDIGRAVSRTPSGWQISDRDSLQHQQIVSNNMTEIALLTLGSCLIMDRTPDSLEKALLILIELKTILEKRHRRNEYDDFPGFRHVYQQTVNRIIDIRWILSLHATSLKKEAEAARHLSSIIELDEDRWYAYNNLAIIYWGLGQPEKSEQIINKIPRTHRRKPLVRLARAFFAIRNNNFYLALKEYKKVKFRELSSAQLVNAIEFLDREIGNHPDNLALLFAFGWLNCKGPVDIEIGRQMLAEFIDRAAKDTCMAPLVDEANKLLN